MNTSKMTDSESLDNSDPRSTNDEPDGYQEENKMEEIFPWQAQFNELCRAAVGSKSMKMLENLLTVYLQKASKTVKDCYMKPNRAGKLKKCMSDAFVFFHLFYQDIKESFENSTYLEKMTELMAMYLDIEIKASRRRKEHVKKVVCRLTTALNVFLDHSENHILDVIIRAKFINKNYREICSPVLEKMLTSLRVYPMNDTLYVRYLLVFKLWKKVVADADKRKNINKIAIQNLPAPSNFMSRYKRFNNVLPRVPNSMNVTTFYMQAKFNLKTACQAFMKISKDPQQPIISDKPLFFEGRLASSQSTFSGKGNAFECGVSRNLMNDIWSIAEPAAPQKKSGDAKSDDGTKKKKDKANKNGKKKTKDWFDKERKKNSKNKAICFENFRKDSSPTILIPQGDSSDPSVPAKEPTAAAVVPVVAVEAKPNKHTTVPKPASVETIPASDSACVQLQEVGAETCRSPFQELSFASQASPTETKPLLNSLTPKLQPEILPPVIQASIVQPPSNEDTKPLALINKGEDMPPPVHVDIPRIRLSPPAEDVAKKEVSSLGEYGISCRKFQDSVVVGGNLFSGQLQEESTRPVVEAGSAEESGSKAVVEIVEVTEVVKARDLSELMEVKALPREVITSIGDTEYLDHEQDVLNEVTIATSELDLSAGENDGELPVYLQCQKEVVIETLDQPSPASSVDSSKNEDEHISGEVEVRTVIIPPSSSCQPKSCFTTPSHCSEAEQLVMERLPVNRDHFKFAIPSPLNMVQNQPVYVEPREEVKPEMGPPPDDLTFHKEVPNIDEDWTPLPFGFFPAGNTSDLFLECMDIRNFELDLAIDPVINPPVIDPCMLEVSQGPGPSVIKRRASEEFSQYSQMCVEHSMHRTRVESGLPPQEFLADDFSPFTANPDHYSYYSARDLYGNYNSNAFFEEPISQTSSRGGLNQKQVPTSTVNSDAPPYNTIDYSSSSLHSSNNSILLACDKGNLARHSRGIRVPSNSDNNYYRETDSHKSQDEQVLRKTDECVVNAKSSIAKQSNSYNSTVVDGRHLLQKGVSSNPHRKTPHPVLVLQDNRRSVGYGSNPADNSTLVDCKVQLSHLRSEETTPTPKPTFRGGMFLGGTGRPMRPARYYSVGVPIPIAIPYPSAPLHDKKCTCHDCFKRAENFLFPEAASAPNTLVQDLHTSGLKTRADELKHQDDQLLKTIEESMKDQSTKENPQLLDGETYDTDGRCRMEPHSTLPLKKRHKLSSDPPESASPEGFPNFGVRPMMSILSIQPGVTNSTRPLQECNSSHAKDDYSSTKPNCNISRDETNELQCSNNVDAIKPVHTVPTGTLRYSSQDVDETEINRRKRDEVIANYFKKNGISQKKPTDDDDKSNSAQEKESVVANRQYKPTQPSRTYPAPTNVTIVNYGEPSENVRRRFKTPAQLKKVPYNCRHMHCLAFNCPLSQGFASWNQNGAESMILHRESYVPQPPPIYRLSESSKPTPSTESKSERKRSTSNRKRPSSASTKRTRKRSTSNRKRPSSASTKRTRCSNRKSQSGSGTGDVSEPKRKRKDHSR